MNAKAYILAVMLLPCGYVIAADAPYPSRSACLRADTVEQCDKLFPEPKRPAAPAAENILLLDTCTGILREATERLRAAVTYRRFDVDDEAMSNERQGWSLKHSAMECVRNANRSSPGGEAEWKAQMLDYESQLAILTAVKRAQP